MYTTYIGTKSVIDACKICKVKRLIHTSSSGVVFDGVHGLFDVNESLPYPDKVTPKDLLKKRYIHILKKH
jgi:nucleoside-diphosphate-sugar epimerase